jgi:hypothetical protein
VSGRKKHRKKNIFYERTARMPPLTVIAQQPGENYTVLWQMDGISKGHQMKQLVFCDEENTDMHLPFIPGQLAADFQRFRNDQKGKRLSLITHVCDTADSAEEEEIERVCCDFLKGTRSEPMILKGGEIQAEMCAALSLPIFEPSLKSVFTFCWRTFRSQDWNRSLMTSSASFLPALAPLKSATYSGKQTVNRPVWEL